MIETCSIPARPKIGERAWVPSIRVAWNHPDIVFSGDLPLIGPKHNDTEVLGFDPEHIHVDLRFVPRKYIDQIKVPPALRVVIFGKLESGLRYPDIKLREFVCLREWPVFPSEQLSRSKELSEHWSGVQMKKMICPHRGISLAACPVVNGVVTCPGHGLKWNVETGKLVR